MLARFDLAAQRTFERANEEAVRLLRRSVGSEHVLLALVDDPDTCQLLQRLGLTATDVRREVEARGARGTHLPLDDTLPWAADVHDLVAAAFEEADGYGHALAGNPHLLLGVLKEDDGLGGRILEECGANLDVLRHEVLEHIAALDEEFEAA